MASVPISIRLPVELLDQLPETETRKPPHRSEFIVAAIREKLERERLLALPGVTSTTSRSAGQP